MHPGSIASRFFHLPRPQSPEHFPLEVLAGNLHLSRTAADEPCLVLIYAENVRLPAGRQTRGLQLTFHPIFHYTVGTSEGSSPCAVLRCVAQELQDYFWIMAGGLVSLASAEAEGLTRPAALLDYVSEWQDLLLNRRELTPQEEIGLWGELWFLLQCPDTDGAAAAWYGPDAKTFDFSANGVDIDVKTSLTGHAHHFRLEQLQVSPSGGRRLIYSLRVIDDPAGGLKVADLIRRIRPLLTDPGPFEKHLLKLHYAEGSGHQFRLTALGEVMVPVGDVPSVTSSAGVSQVHFVSELSHCPCLSQSEVSSVMSILTARKDSGDIE